MDSTPEHDDAQAVDPWKRAKSSSPSHGPLQTANKHSTVYLPVLGLSTGANARSPPVTDWQRSAGWVVQETGLEAAWRDGVDAERHRSARGWVVLGRYKGTTSNNT